MAGGYGFNVRQSPDPLRQRPGRVSVILELPKFWRDAVAIEPDPDGRFVEKAKGLGIPAIIADARRSYPRRVNGDDGREHAPPCHLPHAVVRSQGLAPGVSVRN